MFIVLKKVEKIDAEILLGWRNTPSIVVLGNLARKVTLEEHAAWMERILSDIEGHYFIIVKDDIKCGHVRLELIEPKKYQISIYMLEHFRSKGIGSVVLELLFNSVLHDNESIIAKVLLDNANSQRFFEINGFNVLDQDSKLITYVKRKA